MRRWCGSSSCLWLQSAQQEQPSLPWLESPSPWACFLPCCWDISSAFTCTSVSLSIVCWPVSLPSRLSVYIEYLPATVAVSSALTSATVSLVCQLACLSVCQYISTLLLGHLLCFHIYLCESVCLSVCRPVRLTCLSVCLPDIYVKYICAQS